MNYLDEAVKIAGSQSELGRRINCSPPALSQMVRGIRPIPATKCRAIEFATGGLITRYQLRPDIFGMSVTDTRLYECADDIRKREKKYGKKKIAA